MAALRRWDPILYRHGFLAVALLLLLVAGGVLYASFDVRGVHARQVEECREVLQRGWCGFDLDLGPLVAGILAGLAAIALAAWALDLPLQTRAPKASAVLRWVLAPLVLLLGGALVRELLEPGSSTCVGAECYYFHEPLEVEVWAWLTSLGLAAAGLNLLPLRSRRPTESQ